MNRSRCNLVYGNTNSDFNIEQNELKKQIEENEKYFSLISPFNIDKNINIETPYKKFLKYSLDYDSPEGKNKAIAYEKGLGFTKKNATLLINQIHNYVVNGNNPYEISKTEYGTKYKYRIPVLGANGLRKNVIAVYQIDKGSTKMRLITNYLEAKDDKRI